MMYHTGMTEMPCGFDIVTRVLRRTINAAVHNDSECDSYVDDIMGASSVDVVSVDQTETERVCNSLLGAGAVKPTKSTKGRQQDWIGCTDTRIVTIVKHNYLKARYGFFTLEWTYMSTCLSRLVASLQMHTAFT